MNKFFNKNKILKNYKKQNSQNSLIKKLFLSSTCLFSLLFSTTTAQTPPAKIINTNTSVIDLYNNVVIFGDSLSDDGNIFGSTGGKTPPAPYYQGRFSNGITWVEFLMGSANNPLLREPSTGNLNYAFGGARTDLVSNLNGSKLMPNVGPNGSGNYNSPPGIAQQIFFYQSSSSKLTDKSLVTLWGGANDFFQFFNATAGGANDPTKAGFVNPTVRANIDAQAVYSAGQMATNVSTLVKLGAKNIVLLNLPNFGIAPAFNQDPAKAKGATYATNTFNSALARAVQPVSDVNIYLIDAFSFLNSVASNPSAFGFSNVTDQCIKVISCVTGSKKTQNQYLFWDSVHPTEKGHYWTALAVKEYLTADQFAVATYSLPISGAMDRYSSVLNTFNRLDILRLQENNNTGFYSNYQVSQGRFNVSPNMKLDMKFNKTTSKFEFGSNHLFKDNLIIGATLGITVSDDQLAFVSSKNYNISADVYLAKYFNNNYFINFSAGFGKGEIDNYKRQLFYIYQFSNSATAQTSQYSVATQFGKDFIFGKNLKLTPKAHIGYLSSTVNSFTETGIIAPINFYKRSMQGVIGGISTKLSYNLGHKNPQVIYGEVGYHGHLSPSIDDVTGKIANNFTQAFKRPIANYDIASYYGSIGYSGKLSDNLTLDISYTIDIYDFLANNSRVGSISLQYTP